MTTAILTTIKNSASNTMNNKRLLTKLILGNGGKLRLWLGTVAIFVGSAFLMAAVAVWWNFNTLLYQKNDSDALGFTYLTVGKQVTEDNMGIPAATRFSDAEIEALKQAPQVAQVGAVQANQFPVYATIGGSIGFGTVLPLEAVPDAFIDHKPQDWHWEPGSPELPVILSSQFLDIYNYVFAPGQGLPQLSETSVKSVGIKLTAGTDSNNAYIAHVVGFSNRINGVVVPQSFIEYGNQHFAPFQKKPKPSQLLLQIKDPSDKNFTDLLAKHNYTTNPENLRWQKLRALVEAVILSIGIMAILFLGIGLLIFVLFIELTIAKAQADVTLLIELGYGTNAIGRFLLQKFLPYILGAAFASCLMVSAVQLWMYMAATTTSIHIAPVVGLPVWAIALLNFSVLTIMVSTAVKKSLK
jgi:hypothetical protein